MSIIRNTHFFWPKIQMHVHTGTCVPVHFLIKFYSYHIFLIIVINRLILQILFSGLKYIMYTLPDKFFFTLFS